MTNSMLTLAVRDQDKVGNMAETPCILLDTRHLLSSQITPRDAEQTPDMWLDLTSAAAGPGGKEEAVLKTTGKGAYGQNAWKNHVLHLHAKHTS